VQRFLKKLVLFVLPFLVYGATVLIVDPYRLFTLTALFSQETKREIARPNNYALWTVLDFDRAPGPNILLGDSKAEKLDPKEIGRVSGIEIRNLAMGGASSVEIINLFWYAARRVTPRNAWIGLNFENLNRFVKRDRVKAAEAVHSNFLLYFSSRDVVLSTWQLLKHGLLGSKIETGVPRMSKDEFWKEQLLYAANRQLYGFKFDDDAFAKFAEIAAYCKNHGIRLRFITLPTHADLHQRIRDHGLEAEWQKFPERFRSLAETLDFDAPNEITSARENFEDPFHMTPETASALIRRVWSPVAGSEGVH